jgi:multidrug efflux system membrane fusion protein
MKYLKIIVPIVLLSLVATSCGKKEKQEEKIVRPVQYEKVLLMGHNKVRTFSGTSRTGKVINLSFRSRGIVAVFNLKLGQKVKKGQLLAKLDNVQSRLSYEQALTQQNSAESQMNTAKLSLNRVRLLYEKGSASLSDFEAAKNSFKTANQGFEATKRGVAIQQEQVRFGYLYAPENGVISTVNTEIDENVAAGQPIATLNAGTDMEIFIGIPESAINGIEQGMQVDVSFSSLPDGNFKGKVTEIAPAVDQNTSTYPVRVAIKNSSKKVKSGMAANVTFNLDTSVNQDKKLVVPAYAVGEDSDGRFVYIIEKKEDKNFIKKQHIKIGNLTSEGFEVKSGLTEGQKIATAGLQTLLDGQEVRLQ